MANTIFKPPSDFQEKLLLHEHVLREGTPDPTNLKRNQALLRELSS
jgi:hypothetical protein